MNKRGFVYLVASQKNGTLYVGVTSDLAKRAWQHRGGEIKGFTSRQGVRRLVYYEIHEEISLAIAREKAIKKWRRDWKIELIERNNPDWADLYPEIIS
jgi:putative endonuclease